MLYGRVLRRCLAGCSLALSGGLLAQEPSTTSIPRSAPVRFHGYVVAQSGEDLEGVAVRVLPRGFDDPALRSLTTAEVRASPDLRTAKDGSFEMTADRDAALVFAGERRCTVVVQALHVSSARNHHDLGLVVLPKAGVRIGMVRDLAGKPIDGARVTARGGFELRWRVHTTEHRFWSAVTTGKDGRFVLEGVPRFALDVEVSAPGSFTVRRNLVGEGEALTFELSRSRIVEGRLHGGGVGHSEELWLRASYTGGAVAPPDDWIAVDTAGRFRFTQRAESAARLIGHDRGTGIVWKSGVLEVGALENPAHEVLVLPEVLRDEEGAPRAVEVTVTHAETGEPFVGAEVWQDLSDRRWGGEDYGFGWGRREGRVLAGRTGEDGVAKVWVPSWESPRYGLPLEVEAPGHRSSVNPARVGSDSERVQRKLWPEVTARVCVVDSAGRPLGGARVFWARPEFAPRPGDLRSPPRHVVVTGPDGWCRLVGMPPGGVDLHAWHPDLPLAASKRITGSVGTERRWSLALAGARRVRVRVPPELHGTRVLVTAGFDSGQLDALCERHGSRYRTSPVRSAVTDLDGWATFAALPDLPTHLVVARISRQGVPRMVFDLLGTLPEGGDSELAFPAHGADRRCRVRGRIESAHPDIGSLLVSTHCDDVASQFEGSKSFGPAFGGGLFDLEVVPGWHWFQVHDPRSGILLYEERMEIAADRDAAETLVLSCEVQPVRLLLDVAPDRRVHGVHGQLTVRSEGGTGVLPVELSNGRCALELALPEGTYWFSWVQRFEQPDLLGRPPGPSGRELMGRVVRDAERRDGRQELLLRF